MLRTVEFDGQYNKDFPVVPLYGDNIQQLLKGLESYYPKLKRLLFNSRWQVEAINTISKTKLIIISNTDDLGDFDKIVFTPEPEGARWSWSLFFGLAFGVYVPPGKNDPMNMTPQIPKALTQNNPSADEVSFLFNGAPNVTEQGGAIPIVYGRCMTGGTVLSSSIVTSQIQKVKKKA